MSDALVEVERVGVVGVVTLNRPAAANSLSSELVVALIRALQAQAGDAEVRAVVIAAAGPIFCAGADLSDPLFDPALGDQADAVLERGYRLADLLHRFPVPVVAAVNGPAVGAGVSLTALCDARIAASTATFLLGYSLVGLTPDLGAARTLPYLLGGARALRLALADRPITAADAQRIGLVDDVVDDDDVRAAAVAWAQRLAALPAGVVSRTRTLMLELDAVGFDEAMVRERRSVGESMATESSRAAVADFGRRRARRDDRRPVPDSGGGDGT